MDTQQNHPHEAFLRAYEAESDGIFRYCFFRIGDREKALDMTQEAFMKTWKFIHEGGTVSNIRAFLYKMVSNMVIDEYRRRKPQSSLDTLLEESGFEPSVDEYESMVNQIDGEKALKLLSELKDPYRDALHMRFVQDLSLSEISEITGESQNTIAVRIHRGIAKLYTLFKHEQ